jgi:hypothetical protein
MVRVDGGPALRGGDDAGDDPVRAEALGKLAHGVAGLLLVDGVGDEDRTRVPGQHLSGVSQQSGEFVGGGGQVGCLSTASRSPRAPTTRSRLAHRVTG